MNSRDKLIKNVSFTGNHDRSGLQTIHVKRPKLAR